MENFKQLAHELLACLNEAISEMDSETNNAPQEWKALAEKAKLELAPPLSKEWPESSNIAKTEYNYEASVLEVTFKGNGKKYAYHEFSYLKWQELLLAESIGKYINNSVKGVYQSQQIS